MSPAPKKPAGPTPVESTRHADTRVNIPTGELADFVAESERQPGSALYPRDPSLDPSPSSARRGSPPWRRMSSTSSTRR